MNYVIEVQEYVIQWDGIQLLEMRDILDKHEGRAKTATLDHPNHVAEVAYT